MSVLRRGWPIRLGLMLFLGVGAAFGLWREGPVRAQAPAPQANFAYEVYLPGWNIISSAGDTDASVPALKDVVSGPLYSLRPDGKTETTDLAHMRPGYGYWAYLKSRGTIAYNISEQDSYSISIPAGQCAQVGNPSTKGSARVTGAERVFWFSPEINSYIDGSLIGIGRGAFACNDTRTSTVSVAFAGDRFATDDAFPSCCKSTPSPNRGQSHITFHNDTPAPILVGMRQMDAQGEILSPGDAIRGVIAECPGCSEISGPFNGCGTAAVVLSFDMTPGYYTLHIQAAARNVEDLQINLYLAPDTEYDLCYFINADRLTKNLP